MQWQGKFAKKIMTFTMKLANSKKSVTEEHNWCTNINNAKYEVGKRTEK